MTKAEKPGNEAGERLGRSLGMRLGESLGMRLGSLEMRLGGNLGMTLGGIPVPISSFSFILVPSLLLSLIAAVLRQSRTSVCTPARGTTMDTSSTE